MWWLQIIIDCKALNARTFNDRYPLPHIDDQVSRLSGKISNRQDINLKYLKVLSYRYR